MRENIVIAITKDMTCTVYSSNVYDLLMLAISNVNDLSRLTILMELPNAVCSGWECSSKRAPEYITG